MNPRNGSILLMSLLAGTLAGGACAQQNPAPGAQPAATPAPAPGEFASADDLLRALERADENLTSLTSDIRYDRTFELQGDRQVRTGKLYFVSGRSAEAPGGGQSEAASTRKFAVSFKDLLVGDTFREESKIYIFDGQWLVEKYPKENPPLFIKRQVVPPGQKFDPLRIGEGPFPLPIGQKAAEMKERFNVELLPAGAGLDPAANAEADDKTAASKLGEFVVGSSQIKLVPKPQFAPDEEFTEVRLWYKRDKAGNLLPRMARTVDKSQNVSVVQLINVAVQKSGEPANQTATVPPEMLDAQQPGAGWDVQIVPWQKPANAAAPGGGGASPRHEGADAGDP